MDNAEKNKVEKNVEADYILKKPIIKVSKPIVGHGHKLNANKPSTGYMKRHKNLQINSWHRKRMSYKTKPKLSKSPSNNLINTIDVEKFLIQITSRKKKFLQLETPKMTNFKAENRLLDHWNSHQEYHNTQSSSNRILEKSTIKKTKILASKGNLKTINSESLNKDLKNFGFFGNLKL